MAISFTRSDPVIESLANLGASIRGVGTDVATQRKDELARLGLLQQAEQGRQTAELERLQVEQQGRTGLLETQMKLAEVGERVQRDRERAVREAAEETQRQALRPLEVKRKQFEVEELGPAQLKTFQAQQGAAAVERERATLQSTILRRELERMGRPLTDAQALAFVQGTFGTPAGQHFMDRIPPGTIRTWGDMHAILQNEGLTKPEEVNQYVMNMLSARLGGMDPKDPNRRALQEEFDNRMKSRGLLQRAAVKPEDAWDATMNQLTTALADPSSSPEQIRAGLQLYQSQIRLAPSYKKDVKAENLTPQRVLDFQTVAMQTIDHRGRFKRGTAEYTTAVDSESWALALAHGTPQRMIQDLGARKLLSDAKIQMSAEAVQQVIDLREQGVPDAEILDALRGGQATPSARSASPSPTRPISIGTPAAQANAQRYKQLQEVNKQVEAVRTLYAEFDDFNRTAGAGALPVGLRDEYVQLRLGGMHSAQAYQNLRTMPVPSPVPR